MHIEGLNIPIQHWSKTFEEQCVQIKNMVADYSDKLEKRKVYCLTNNN